MRHLNQSYEDRIATGILNDVTKGSTFEVELAKWIAARKWDQHFIDLVTNTYNYKLKVRLANAAAKAKKATTQAHCQICERLIQNKTGVIAHHGYQRPGWGYQTASCFGARYRSYEEACDALPLYIDQVSVYLGGRENELAELISNPPKAYKHTPDPVRNRAKEIVKTFPTEVYKRPKGFDPRAPRDQFEFDQYIRRFHSERYKLETEIAETKRELDRVTKRLKAWKG